MPSNYLSCALRLYRRDLYTFADVQETENGGNSRLLRLKGEYGDIAFFSRSKISRVTYGEIDVGTNGFANADRNDLRSGCRRLRVTGTHYLFISFQVGRVLSLKIDCACL